MITKRIVLLHVTFMIMLLERNYLRYNRSTNIAIMCLTFLAVIATGLSKLYVGTNVVDTSNKPELSYSRRHISYRRIKRASSEEPTDGVSFTDTYKHTPLRRHNDLTSFRHLRRSICRGTFRVNAYDHGRRRLAVFGKPPQTYKTNEINYQNTSFCWTLVFVDLVHKVLYFKQKIRTLRFDIKVRFHGRR